MALLLLTSMPWFMRSISPRSTKTATPSSTVVIETVPSAKMNLEKEYTSYSK
ncbi:MAG: hypothetical protein FWG70_03705 [Oscillospiraceae bacterium]|nr:hypothetical protein [Oscillospiraceae bacterium]